MQTFFSTTTRSRICLPVVRCRRHISLNAEHYANLVPPKQAPTFEAIGLRPALARALRNAFPNVRQPTEIQSALIPAIMKGKDVVLQDEAGSGKSFGLILALLNKPRLSFAGLETGDVSSKPSVTSLFLVPHRDLAFQLLHWIRRITEASTDDPPPLNAIAQVLVREGKQHLTTGLSLLRENPPHVLIATPSSLLEVLREDPDALQLAELSSVVLDEVDYLIETVPLKGNTVPQGRATRNIRMHPGHTRQLLDVIYEHRPKLNADNRDVLVDEPYHIPQLIISSATVRRHLKHYFFTESRYLNGEVVKIRGSVMRLHGKDELATREVSLHENISHHVLVVSDEGITNIPGAIESKADAKDATEETEDLNDTVTPSSPPTLDDVTDSERLIGFSMTPSPLNQNSLEAIAAAFAMDVPSIALLVIPSNASVHRAVYDLREMGVNAHGMDLLVENRGQSYLLQGKTDVFRHNPALLVCTTASMRGIDFPALTHVFILGVDTLEAKRRVNPTLTLDNYIHLAGRVGRFRKKGKVIMVVEKEDDSSTGREVSRVRKILDKLGITPIRLNMFE